MEDLLNLLPRRQTLDNTNNYLPCLFLKFNFYKNKLYLLIYIKIIKICPLNQDITNLQDSYQIGILWEKIASLHRTEIMLALLK